MINKVEQKLPKKLVIWMRKWKNRIEISTIFRRDRAKFLRYYSKRHCQDLEQIKARIIFFSHSLEKGLAREKIRLGYGQEVAKNLLFYMEKLLMQEQLEDLVLINGASIINQYLQLHHEYSYELSFIPNKYAEVIKICRQIAEPIGGAKTIITEKFDGNYKNYSFDDLVKNRHSVRDYSGKELDFDLIDQAIRLAMKSPSVCNRQSSRVYVITEQEKIRKALMIQGGFKGYNLPPCLLLITTDTRYFIDISEKNQIYIDGGIFGMSLLYGLEFYRLGACALNAMFSHRKEKQTKRLLTIGPSENLIMYISVGHFKDQYSVPKSFRLDAKKITNYV